MSRASSGGALGGRTPCLRQTGLILALGLGLLVLACGGGTPDFDVLVTGGTVYDGTGGSGVAADLGIRLDRIVEVGDLSGRTAELEIDASGMAVAPGFVNMLSWATESLLVDGRSLSDLSQGVTLEVFGEGTSMGPANEAMRQRLEEQAQGAYQVDWETLGEYLESLERRGIATNVASYVGATTVRIQELGFENRAPGAEELERMKGHVRTAMEEGALGVGSSLIYAPAFYADTAELIELSKVAAAYGGGYISHMRSEGNQLLEAIDELVEIARQAEIRAEIYHLKAAGENNWPKLEPAIERIEQARDEGLEITANMYTYVAGATGLNATMPPWVQEGGYEAWAQRLADPQVRRRVVEEMQTPSDSWENLLLMVGDPSRVLLTGFRDEGLRRHIGSTLAEVAAERNSSPEETAIDLVLEDGSRVEAVYFMMSEDNVERQLELPWMSFGSDAGSMAPEGVFLESMTHPRAYGNFARLLGRYVREREVLGLSEAIRRLTSLPADNLRIRDRGRLQPGFFADVVVFDPQTITDHATFEQPHQLATGVDTVLVNGTVVLEDGQATGATPGRVVRGPGWTGWSTTEAGS